MPLYNPGTNAATPAATDNSTAVATTAFCWSMPAVQQIPDNTATGGSARGTNAVDWQSSRTANTMVASGTGATVGGGINNTAAGAYSTIAGGSANQVNSGSGWVPGGMNATVRAINCGAWSGGRFAANGDAQSGEYSLRRATTNATPTNLTVDSNAPASTNLFGGVNNSTMLARILVVARQTSGSAGVAGDSAAWDYTVLMQRGAAAANTVVVSAWGGIGNTGAGAQIVAAGTAITPIIASSAGAYNGASAWRVAFSADTANGGLLISVTGELNKNIQWVARVISVETVG